MKLSHILLAACMFAPLAAHAETPKDRTVAVIEEAGCVLDAGSVAQIVGRDSSRESSVVAGRHEQTHTRDVQDPELAGL